jgi:DNA-binding NtrC family response regulator
MMLPRVLVVDDFVGDTSSPVSRRIRSVYCGALGLRDLDGRADDPRVIVAEAKFCSGQQRTADGPINSLEEITREFRAGWPSADGRYWSAVLVDMKFGDEEQFGLRVIETLHRLSADVPMIVVSKLDQLKTRAGETLRNSAERLGAADFLAAPDSDSGVDRAFLSTPANLAERLRVLGLLPDPEQRIVGTSLAICKALRGVRQRIPPDGVGQVLLVGEAGSGKTYLRDYVLRHLAQLRHVRPTDIVLQAPSLTGSDADHQKMALFGTMGAANVEKSPGAFEHNEKNGDIIVFLDEIGEMKLGSQADLLGVLQVVKDRDGKRYRLFSRMGSGRQQLSRAFVLAATNRDLSQMVTEGAFRADLLQRLDQSRVSIPPLRERQEDVPLLVAHAVRTACNTLGVEASPIIDVPPDSWRHYAQEHSVRELVNGVEGVIAASPFKTLFGIGDFQHMFERREPGQRRPEADRTIAPAEDVLAAVTALVDLLGSWEPPPHMPIDDFASAFPRMDRAFAAAKLQLWRGLLARQEASGGTVNLFRSVQRLTGSSEIAKSKPADLSLQLFKQAGVDARPDDHLLGELWDSRRGARSTGGKGLP